MKNLILFLSILVIPFSAFSAEEKTQVIFVKGLVELNDGKNGFVQIEKGEEIFEGDELKTDKNSYAVLRLNDNSVIKVEPESSFIIEKFAPIVENKSFGVTETILKKGRAFFQVPNQDKQEVLKIKTSDVSFAVRGTNFLVDTEKEDVWLGVKEGEVEVVDPRDKNKKEVVLPGEGMKVEKGRKFTKPKRYSWLQKVRFNNRDFKNLDSGFRDIRGQRMSEFRKKREDWKFNPDRYKKRQKIWQDRKTKFRERNKRVFERLKGSSNSLRANRGKRKASWEQRFKKSMGKNRKSLQQKRSGQGSKKRKNMQGRRPRRNMQRRMPPRSPRMPRGPRRR